MGGLWALSLVRGRSGRVRRLAQPERAAGDCVQRRAVGRFDVGHHALDRSMP
jgi:hypothetical protein